MRHSLVEKKLIGKVLMDKEMLAIKSANKMLASKPEVAKVKNEMRNLDRGRDKFYGPNLPVAWGNDVLPIPKGGACKGVVDLGVDENESEDSPSEDVSGTL